MATVLADFQTFYKFYIIYLFKIYPKNIYINNASNYINIRRSGADSIRITGGFMIC